LELNAALHACHKTYQSGDLETAEKQYQQLIAEHPVATDAYHLGALIMMRSGQLGNAFQRIETALSGQKNHHEYWNTKGNILAAMQNVPRALNAYRESLRLKPDYVQAAQNLGQCLINNDDPAAAVEVYERAIQHNPGNEQLRIGHVIALRAAVRSEDAIIALDAWEAEDKSGRNYDYVRGQVLIQLGDAEKAIATNKRVLHDPIVGAPALQNLMQLYWMRGEWDEGEKQLQSLLTADTTPMGMFVTAAQIYLRIDKAEKAVDVLNKAGEKFGETPEIRATRGRIALESGEYEKSWDHAKAALTARPGDMVFMELYASAALVTGRHNDAMIAAHGALKVQPNNQFWIAVKYTAGRAMGQDHKYYADTDKFVKAFKLTPPEKYGSLENFNKELKAALDELHQFEQRPLDQSLLLGTQTATDLRFAKNPVIQDFFKALDVPIRSYMDELGANPNQPLEGRNTGDYRFAGAWSVRLGPGGHHVNHVHPKGWISSSYYVDVPPEVDNETDKKGWIQFGKPPFAVKDLDEQELTAERIIKPEPGLVVLFPSYMWHGTIPIEGDATRLTLPFDVVPA
jgi:uncharacterized protein (TIGR02466 family)